MKPMLAFLKSLILPLAIFGGISMANAQVPVRIMPLGDSITAGEGASRVISGGYRERLYSLLTSPTEGYAVDFVGSLKYPNAVAEGWVDGDHEGHPGFKIAEIRSGIEFWLKGVPDPDVILLHIGTNDFSTGASVAATKDQLTKLLAELSALRPHARIILASLIRRTDSFEATQLQFNQSLPGIVAAQAALGRKVSFVDMHAGFGTNPGDLADPVHPTSSGYDKMADVWLPVIKSVITPSGTTTAPAIASISALEDLGHVAVTFSKPINDADGANPANFSLSGGVSISQASLDASKRVVTLTTGTQAAGTSYTLTVSGVRDRMVPENVISAATTANFTSLTLLDGSFEQSNVAWLRQASAVIADSTFYRASYGQNLVVFSGADTANDGVVSQSITTVPNQKYVVRFDMGVYASSGSPQVMKLTVRDGLAGGGGQVLISPASQSMNGGGAPGFPATRWQILSFPFTAVSNTTAITFEDVSALTAGIDLLLDDVRLEAVFNIAPVAVNDGGIGTPVLTVSKNSGASSPIAVLTNDSDSDGNSLTVTAAASPNGSVVVNGGQTLAFTPNIGFSGETTIFYTISDGNGGTAGATAWVFVTASGPFANGSFEDGSPVDNQAPAGWEVIGSVITYSSQGFYVVKPGNGNWAAIFNPGNNVAVSRLSQTFDTTVGQAYTVSFDAGLAGGVGAKAQTLAASVSGVLSPPGQVTSWSVTSSAQPAQWLVPSKSFTFTATDPTTEIMFTVDITSGGLSTQDVDLLLDKVNVMPVNVINQPPAAVADSYTTSVNVPISVSVPGVLGNDTDDGPSALTAVVNSPPNQGGSLTLNANGGFYYVPATNLVGTETFTYRAFDGSLYSPVVTVTITINSAGAFVNGSFEDGPPVNFGAIPGWSAVGVVPYADTQYYIPASGNGSWMAVFNPPSYAPLVSTLSQTFATVAGREYKVAFDAGLAGGVGSKMQVLQAAVSGGTIPPEFPTTWNIASTAPLANWAQRDFNFVADGSSATLTFSVNRAASTNSFDVDLVLDDVRLTPLRGPEQPPVAVDDGSVGAPFATLAEDSGTAGPLAVLVNDNDPNLDLLTVTLASSPNGTVVINGGTTLSFTPALNFSGVATISYTISDGFGGTASAVVYVAVTAVNDAPVAVDDGSAGSPFVTVAEDTTAAAIPVLANDSDLELNSLAVVSASSPNGVVAVNVDQTLGFTPVLNFNGATTISYTISDGQGGSASATVFVSVTPVNDAPVAVDDGSPGSPFVVVPEDSASAAIPVLANDSDVDGDSPTVTVASSPNGTVTVNVGQTLGFTPALNFNGATTISYTISDGQGSSVSATVSVSVTPVNDAPVAVDDGSAGSPLVTVAEDTASAAIPVLANDTDLEPDPLSVASASSTNGVVVVNVDQTLGFTPALNFTGATTISYTISDGQGGSASATVFVSVTPVNDAPVAVDDGGIGSAFLTVAEDSGISAPVHVLANDTDVEGNPLAVVAASSPAGVVVVNVDQTLGFTPALNFNGATTIAYTISDGQGGSASAMLFVSVTPVNDMPVAVNDGSVGSPFLTVLEDSAASAPMLVLANDSDIDSDPLEVTTAISPGGTVGINSGTTLSFTPALNFNGATTIFYTISDGQGGTSSATVFVFVTPVNDPPVVDDQSVAVNEDGVVTITLTGSDVDGDSFLLAGFGGPAHGSLQLNGAVAIYTPNPNYNGPDSFNVIGFSLVGGPQISETATVSITVNPVNDAPEALAGTAVTNEDTPVNITLAGDDLDQDVNVADLTYTVVSNPAHGVLTGTGRNRIYTPGPNFNGADSFMFKVNDGSLDSNNTAKVSITVTPVNDAPVAVDDGSIGLPLLTVVEDSGLSLPVDVLANDSDLEGDSLAVTAASSSGGDVVVNVDQTLSFTPRLNITGATTISYTISDGQGGVASGTVFVSVTTVNDAPVAVDDGSAGSPFVTVAEDTTAATIPVLANDSDVDGDLLSVTAANSPGGAVVINVDQTLSFTPALNLNGTTTISYTISDDQGSFASATVYVSVTAGNDVPVAVDDGSAGSPFVTVAEDTAAAAIPVLANDSDVDGDLLEVTASSSPNGDVVINVDQTLSFTPALNFTGATTISYTISDGQSGVASGTVFVSVTTVNDAPVAVDDGSAGSAFVTVAEDTTAAVIPVLANDSDVDGDSLAVMAASSSGGDVVVNVDQTLSFTPGLNFNGATTISYTISDSQGGSASATVFVSVTAGNDVPVAVDDGSAGSSFVTVAEDTAATAIPVLVNDSDVDGDLLDVTAASSPNGTVTVNLDQTLSFTPGLNFTGATTISYTISDGQTGVASATVFVSVTAVNDAPVAVDDGAIGSAILTVAEDSGISSPVNVLANDSDVDGDSLSVTAASSSGGAVVINVDQTLSFTPGLNFNGATTISYTISDGQGGPASATVFVSVTAVNDAPVAVNDGSAGSPLVTVAEDTAAVAIAVLSNDSDVDGDALSVAATSSPNGTVTVNVDRTLSFTPALNFNGATTISYTISDGQGGSASATAFVSVTSVDDAPVANPQLVTVAEDGTALVVLTGIDVDGDPLLFATALQPIHGTLSLTGAVATYRPNSGFHGQDSFTFFAYTFNGGQPVFSAVATVSITVTQREDYEVWAEQFQLSTGPDSDPDGDSISNAVEYVIGGDPVDSPDSALVPTAELVSANLDGNPGNEDYLVFSYRRTDLAKDDPSATINVEWSTNLAGLWSGTGGMVAQVTDGVGVDLVKVYIPRSLAVAGKLFVRLGVTISTPPSNE